MGSTASTAHRLEKRRAWHLPHFDDKMVQKVKAEVADKCGRSVGLLGFRPPAHFVGSKKITTVWSTLSQWGGRPVGLLGFRPSVHFVVVKKNRD